MNDNRLEEIKNRKEKLYTSEEYRFLQNQLEKERKKNEQLKNIITMLLKDF